MPKYHYSGNGWIFVLASASKYSINVNVSYLKIGKYRWENPTENDVYYI